MPQAPMHQLPLNLTYDIRWCWLDRMDRGQNLYIDLPLRLFDYSSVTQPSDAEATFLMYLNSVPLVAAGGGGTQSCRRLSISVCDHVMCGDVSTGCDLALVRWVRKIGNLTRVWLVCHGRWVHWEELRQGIERIGLYTYGVAAVFVKDGTTETHRSTQVEEYCH